jgi:hypothetical protein
MTVLSELLEVAQSSIGQAINETQPLLEDHGHTIAPTTLHFTSASALHEFLHTAPNRPGPAWPSCCPTRP